MSEGREARNEAKTSKRSGAEKSWPGEGSNFDWRRKQGRACLMAREKMRQSVFEKSGDSEKTLVLELPATEEEGEGEKKREKSKEKREKRKEKRERRKEKREKRKEKKGIEYKPPTVPNIRAEEVKEESSSWFPIRAA